MNRQIWILGATGRSGRGIAERLHSTGHQVVLAGRDTQRLDVLSNTLGGTRVVAGSLEDLLSAVREQSPSVVVSTVGPFGRTATQVIDACPPGTNYVDIGNELRGTQAVLNRHGSAVERGATYVTASGFGALATEAVAMRVCADRPKPIRVRVDAIPSLASAGDAIGQALAGSMLDNAPDGGRRVHHHKLVRAAVLASRLDLITPDGDEVKTASLPTGDLLAAWRATDADSVVSATAAVPSGPAIRAMFPVLSLLLRSSALRRRAIARLAQVNLPRTDRPRTSSWSRAQADWADGTTRETWLRIGDAQEFTEDAAAEVARRLLDAPRLGAYTPAALFSPTLATDLGAEFVEHHSG